MRTSRQRSVTYQAFSRNLPLSFICLDQVSCSNGSYGGEVPSAPSTPATPGTPGAPLFGAFKGENGSGNVTRKALRKSWGGKCFTVDQEWGMHVGRSVSCSISPPLISLAKKVGAEFLGTLMLIFAATATAIVNQKTEGSETLVGLAASCGLAAMVVILSTDHISGGHVNPAVTIAFAALKHFPWKHVPLYIGAQVMGSLFAAFALKGVFHPYLDRGVTVPSAGYGQAFALEFIISFNLIFVVTAVATDTRALGELAGIAVGATVMLNVLIAGYVANLILSFTRASMNPVRTLGRAIAAKNFKAIWVYLISPILGPLCGVGAYTAIKRPKEDGEEEASTARSFRR